MEIPTTTSEVDSSSADEVVQRIEAILGSDGIDARTEYVDTFGGIVLFSYGIIRDFQTKYSKRYGWDFMGGTWKKAFRTWVLEFERHMRDDMGMDYSEYAVQLWDEATEKNAELTVDAGTDGAVLARWEMPDGYFFPEFSSY